MIKYDIAQSLSRTEKISDSVFLEESYNLVLILNLSESVSNILIFNHQYVPVHVKRVKLVFKLSYFILFKIRYFFSPNTGKYKVIIK